MKLFSRLLWVKLNNLLSHCTRNFNCDGNTDVFVMVMGHSQWPQSTRFLVFVVTHKKFIMKMW